MSDYREVIIETYVGLKTHASQGIRARPVAGQGFDTSMNVECSTKMRKSHPVGTRFRLMAKLTSRDGGAPFLYSSFRQPYEVVGD